MVTFSFVFDHQTVKTADHFYRFVFDRSDCQAVKTADQFYSFVFDLSDRQVVKTADHIYSFVCDLSDRQAVKTVILYRWEDPTGQVSLATSLSSRNSDNRLEFCCTWYLMPV